MRPKPTYTLSLFTQSKLRHRREVLLQIDRPSDGKSQIRPIARIHRQVPAQGAGEKYRVFAEGLLQQFGRYCFACESRLTTDLQVDHRVNRESQSDSDYGDFPIQYLVLCPACNRRKLNRVGTAAQLVQYFWPDVHNTYLVFKYTSTGSSIEIEADTEAIEQGISLIQEIDPPQDRTKNAKVVEQAIQRANNTIWLFGLNEEETYSGEAGDLRKRHRLEVHQIAATVSQYLRVIGTPTEPVVAIQSAPEDYYEAQSDHILLTYDRRLNSIMALQS